MKLGLRDDVLLDRLLQFGIILICGKVLDQRLEYQPAVPGPGVKVYGSSVAGIYHGTGGNKLVRQRTVRVLLRGRRDHNAGVGARGVAAVGANVAEELLKGKGLFRLDVVIDRRRSGWARGGTERPEKEHSDSGGTHGCGRIGSKCRGTKGDVAVDSDEGMVERESLGFYRRFDGRSRRGVKLFFAAKRLYPTTADL